MGARRSFLIGTICIAALAGCAHSEHATGYDKAEPSGFLKDYSKLHAAANETDSTLLYFTPDKAKFKSYTKVWVEPVQVWRGEESDAKDLDKEDATHLSQFLWSRLDEEFRKDYQMVQEPGPGVMRLRVGITEAGKNIPVLDNLTAPVSMVLYDGKKSLGGISRLSARRRLKRKRPTVRPVNCWPPPSIAGEAANMPGSRCIAGVMSKRPIPIGPRSLPGGLA